MTNSHFLVIPAHIYRQKIKSISPCQEDKNSFSVLLKGVDLKTFIILYSLNLCRESLPKEKQHKLLKLTDA